MSNCRLCNRQKRSTHPIFKVAHSRAKVKAGSLPDQIRKYVGIQVEFGDTLPSVICSDCRNRVIQWHRFVIKCKKVELILNASCNTLCVVETTTTETTDFASPTTVEAIQKPATSHDVAVNQLLHTEPTAPKAATSIVLDDETEEAVLFIRSSIEVDGFVSVVEKDDELSTVPVTVESVLIHDDRISSPSATTKPETYVIVGSQAKVDLEKVDQIDRADVFMDTIDRDELKNPVPNVNSFHCKHCNKTYKSKHRFKEHVVTAHEKPKNHICEQCSKVFTLRSSLKSHLQTHAASRNFCCQFCGVTFQTNAALRSHLTTHRAGYARHACDVCGKDFKLRQQLARHKLSHSDVRAYACAACPLTFIARHHLARHVKNIHSAPTLHTCPACNKHFRYLNHYRTHLVRHAGVRDKTCDKCDKAFVTRQSLLNHLKVHDKEKKYKCPLCAKTFSDYSNHKRHVLKHSAPSSVPPAPRPPTPAPDADSKTYASLETFYQPPEEIVALMENGDEYANIDIDEFLPSEECVVDEENGILVTSQVYNSLTLKSDLKSDMTDFSRDMRHVGNLFSSSDGFEMGLFLEEGNEGEEEDLFPKDDDEETGERDYEMDPKGLIDSSLLD